MRIVGIIMLVIGLLGLIGSYSIDTTVPTGTGGRVHNIGLMSEKQNLLLVFAAISIVGAILNDTGLDARASD